MRIYKYNYHCKLLITTLVALSIISCTTRPNDQQIVGMVVAVRGPPFVHDIIALTAGIDQDIQEQEILYVHHKESDTYSQIRVEKALPDMSACRVIKWGGNHINQGDEVFRK